MHSRSIVSALVFICLLPSTAFAGCGAFQSSPSSQPADIKFVNKTAKKVDILWYKFNGGTRKYRSLAPHQSYVQATFTQHVWAFIGPGGACVGTFVVRGSGTHAIH